MHHLYPLAKGDPLCPLGFHPQVRWPTRCKRCFRDYKEHGGKKKEEDFKKNDITSSSPNLSLSSLKSTDHKRSWSSSSNLSEDDNKNSKISVSNLGPASWTSTPDLGNLEDNTHANIPTVSLTLPKRKQLPVTINSRTVSDSVSSAIRESSPTYNKIDALTTRAKKLQAIKEASQEISKRIQIKELKATVDEDTNHDVQFLIQVKSKVKQEKNKYENEEDAISIAGTDTTDTTLVGNPYDRELQEQIDSLKQELELTKTKCDRLEREKSDLLLRRLASKETVTSKTTATEVLKLQQRCNELQSQIEDIRDDKKSLTLRVKELEEDLENRPSAQAAQKVGDELRSKLLAAETLCEELMDENEDMKKELRDLEEEIEELQDNFREDQANEYTSLKKELEQTTKNCRILSFKLRKTERKTEQLEVEKGETEKKLREVSGGRNYLDRIKDMEQELKVATETSLRLQKELEETTTKLNALQESGSKKKIPMLGNIPKISSLEGKVSRESLTRGGSQDDPAQLLRDLHDSLEREADLREQLKFAEEEAQNFRKKASRIEDDNESLVLQLKKMATKAKSRKGSPNSLTPEPVIEKDEGISEDDPAELKLLLELNDQEVSVLRKKVEELEFEKDAQKLKVKELQDKLASKTTKKSVLNSTKVHDMTNKQFRALEEEATDLKKKLAEKDKEAQRLTKELNLMQKATKGIQKSKSLDIPDARNIDIKQQLQSIEQEAVILRTKIQTLESENEKLVSENKRLQLVRVTKKADKSSEKYIDKIAELEVELEYAGQKIKQLEEDAKKGSTTVQLSQEQNEKKKRLDTNKKLEESMVQLYKNRTPKKPSEFTSKVQLKNMVKDLENEIADILIILSQYEDIKSKLEIELKETKSQTTNNINKTLNEFEETKKKLANSEKELENVMQRTTQDRLKYDDTINSLTKKNQALSAQLDNEHQILNELSKLKDINKHLEDCKEKLEGEIAASKIQSKAESIKESELQSYKDQIECLKSELSKKEKIYSKLKIDFDEKEKSLKELKVTIKKIGELEKLLEDNKDKMKKNEKQHKDEIRQLSAKLTEERDKLTLKEHEQLDISTKFLSEQKQFNLQIEELNSKILALENTISSKNAIIEQLEESVKKGRETAANRSTNVKEINSLRSKLNDTVATLKELETKLENANRDRKFVEEKLTKAEKDFKKEKLALEQKLGEVNIDLQNEKKKLDVAKANHEKDNKNKETELNSLKNQVRALELNSTSGNKKVSDIKMEYQERIEKLENTISTKHHQYQNLTAKYEVLEEEYIVTKAKLVMEKETITNQLAATRRELENDQFQLKELKSSYASRNDILTKDIEQSKKENEVLSDQLEHIRKENDELRKKLDDYDKVTKIQRVIGADTTAMEKEIQQLRSRLVNIEELRKSDLAKCKLRYDSQVNVINEEIRSLQTQVTRFKRERDTYKHMLEGAQQAMEELKNSSSSRKNQKNFGTTLDEEEYRTKVASLEQQVSCMEDELSEARLEASKVKTEFVSERSSWEIKISELHSRVNELEEERILSSGRTKIPGLKTRMELAWHKEREEQQRLLQETSTLARDLRQTLFEVERERDKERLDSKRKQEQLKKALEEDQDENRRKLTELQCDLLELRDAHAKLRTTNEKLRREKERNEKEREEFRSIINGKKRSECDEDRRINALLEQVEILIRLTDVEDVTAEKNTYTPTPPRRTRGSKSRETSPTAERRDFAKESSVTREDRKLQIQSAVTRLCNVTSELRRYQELTENNRERERVKRSMGLRRATSTEHDDLQTEVIKRKLSGNGNSSTKLHRKSLSLEHTLQNEQTIWRNDEDSVSSLQSIDGVSDFDARWGKRDASLDSRLSSGSTQSETGASEKKKKGLIGKLKKLAKSRSIDDQDPGHFSVPRNLSSKQNSGSNVNEEKSSKKDLRERLTGIFKKGGSSSRSNSLERQQDHSSTQRPLMPNGSNSSLSFPSPKCDTVSKSPLPSKYK